MKSIDHPDQIIYKTDAWNGKFKYGAATSLISSWYIRKHKEVIGLLCDPRGNQAKLDALLPVITADYDNCSFELFENILKSANANRLGKTVFDEGRDFCRTDRQNAAFIIAMGDSRFEYLKPVDSFLEKGQEVWGLIQFNAHRGLYHTAYGIPQNSLAAIFNAFMAGIRSVEFDVLETKDYKSIVVHDLVTNRLDGKFDDPPKYVELWNADDVLDTNVGTLDPLGEAPKVDPTEAYRIMTTRDVLWAVKRWMPGLTLYADASNNAPISLLRLLRDEPDLNLKGLAMKVYPCTLQGGVYDIVKEYSRRYTKDDRPEAIKEIRKVNANFLLAMNALPNEVAERTARSQDIGLNCDLSLETMLRGEKSEWTLRNRLPFDVDSVLSPPGGGPSYSNPWGKPIFDQGLLQRINGRTFLSLKWMIEMSTIATVRVFQIGLTPSLVRLIDAGRDFAPTLRSIPLKDQLVSAVTDNINAAFKLASEQELVLTLPGCDGQSATPWSAWHRVVLGFADRYPDFAFAERNKIDGSVDQATLKDYYYDMEGRVYSKANDYGAKLMRSVDAIGDALNECNSFGTSNENRGGYITTDLQTDLRTWAMFLNSEKIGFPENQRYRVGGMIKAALNDYETFVPRPWSKKLFGKLGREFPTFDKAYKEVKDLIESEVKLERAIDALQSYHDHEFVLINPEVLQNIGAEGEWYGPLRAGDYDSVLLKLKSKLVPVNYLLLQRVEDFADTFKVNFDGTPVGSAPLPTRLPEGRWDA